MVKVDLSILAADFSRLGHEVKRAERGGTDFIHIDVILSYTILVSINSYGGKSFLF